MRVHSWIIGLIGLVAGLSMALPAGAQNVVSQGSWTTAGYAVEGQWKIVSQEGGWVLELPASFSTKKAPDLKLFLSKRSPGELSNRNATDGSVLIAPLKSPQGAQTYRLPGDPAGYTSLLIHCEKYSKLWAVAPLK